VVECLLGQHKGWVLTPVLPEIFKTICFISVVHGLPLIHAEGFARIIHNPERLPLAHARAAEFLRLRSVRDCRTSTFGKHELLTETLWPWWGIKKGKNIVDCVIFLSVHPQNPRTCQFSKSLPFPYTTPWAMRIFFLIEWLGQSLLILPEHSYKIAMVKGIGRWWEEIYRATSVCLSLNQR
jgi:hypothetical protein